MSTEGMICRANGIEMKSDNWSSQIELECGTFSIRIPAGSLRDGLIRQQLNDQLEDETSIRHGHEIDSQLQIISIVNFDT